MVKVEVFTLVQKVIQFHQEHHEEIIIVQDHQVLNHLNRVQVQMTSQECFGIAMVKRVVKNK